MFKKLTLGVLGLVLVGGFLFGSSAIPYAKQAYQSTKTAINDSVPIEFQIETAKTQLSATQSEVRSMVYKIAQEKAQINRLENDLNRQNKALVKSYDEMMALREHVSSGDEYYVGTNGKNYGTQRVKEDLAHRFSVYQTAEATKEKSEQILDLRKQGLTAAFDKLEQTRALQRELAVQIENLSARNKMVEVAKSASDLNIDDSQLSRTRTMVEDISARIDTEEEMANLAPQYFGQIPVGEGSIDVSNSDIVDEIDSYFEAKDTTPDEEMTP